MRFLNFFKRKSTNQFRHWAHSVAVKPNSLQSHAGYNLHELRPTSLIEKIWHSFFKHQIFFVVSSIWRFDFDFESAPDFHYDKSNINTWPRAG